jgi:hypothetical protein
MERLLREAFRVYARSNKEIDSTCEVLGNMLAMPAPRSA